MKKRLVDAALRIVEIEKEFIEGKINLASFNKEIDMITKKLSINDMLAIDDYIMTNHLLD